MYKYLSESDWNDTVYIQTLKVRPRHYCVFYGFIPNLLFVCIPNFGHTIIRIFNTCHLIKKISLCYSQDYGKFLPILVRHKIQNILKGVIPKMKSSAIFVLQMWWRCLPWNETCHVTIMIKTDLLGFAVTMHSGLCEQYIQFLALQSRDWDFLFVRTLHWCHQFHSPRPWRYIFLSEPNHEQEINIRHCIRWGLNTFFPKCGSVVDLSR